MAQILNYTPHNVNIVRGAEFDPTIRKYRGGEIINTIPSNGMVSAKAAPTAETEPILLESIGFLPDMEIPTMEAPKWESVDPLPDAAMMDMVYRTKVYYIVSNLYVSACKELGIPTDRLLTVGNMVVEEDGRTVRGATCLIRN